MKLLAVRWVVIMALLFILTACGGGGDDESTAIRMPDDPVTEQPEPELPDVTEPDPEPELPDVATLPTPRAVDGGTYYRGDRETVVSYLQDVLGSEPVRRFSGTPVLRVREGTPAQEIEQIQLAVADLNAFLPEANEIHFETVVQVAAAAGPEAGVIVVSIGEPCPNAQVCQGGGLATAYDGLAAVGEAAATFGVDVLLLDRLSTHEFFCLGDVECSNAKFRSLVVHELLHALGLRGHVRDSVASAINEYGTRGLQPSDEDGLTALYTLDEGDSVTELGDWAIVHHVLEGYFEDPFNPDSRITFGVRLNNGRPEAFVEGPPAPALTTRGPASWGGALLGMTPAQATVAGDAHLTVDLDDMTGRADFTRLETWDGEPGAPGTGATWNAGRLGYAIAVDGNAFSQTGGDAGTLRGVFFGERHIGMGGTLERDDLTAAFGGINAFWND